MFFDLLWSRKQFPYAYVLREALGLAVSDVVGMSGAEAYVRVRVRPSVVAVAVEDASVATIVPVATGVERTLLPTNELFPLLNRLLAVDGLQPSAKHFP